MNVSDNRPTTPERSRSQDSFFTPVRQMIKRPSQPPPLKPRSVKPLFFEPIPIHVQMEKLNLKNEKAR
jgi:hypothetical protein